MLAFGLALPTLRERIEGDLARPGVPRRAGYWLRSFGSSDRTLM